MLQLWLNYNEQEGVMGSAVLAQQERGRLHDERGVLLVTRL